MRNILVLAGSHEQYRDYIRDKDMNDPHLAYTYVQQPRSMFGRLNCEYIVIGTFGDKTGDFALLREVKEYTKSHGILAHD